MKKLRMNTKQCIFLPVILFYLAAFPHRANGMFGADAAAMIPFLVELIAKAVQQYNQLKSIYKGAEEHKRMIEEINMGLNEAIGLLETMPIRDENVLSQLKTFKRAVGEVERVYGTTPEGSDQQMHRLHDESVAESLKIVNALKGYAGNQEQNAHLATERAKTASPKGAARATLETNAAILHTLNQLLRVNGQMLKLQGEQLAFSNKQSKESARHYQKVNQDIGKSLEGFWGDFSIPRFDSGG